MLSLIAALRRFREHPWCSTTKTLRLYWKSFGVSRIARTLAACAPLLFVLSAPAAHAYTRPFGAAAPWNVPAANKAVDPASATLVNNLWVGTGLANRDGASNLNLTVANYSYPVYDIAGTTGTCQVKSRTGWASNIVGTRIPCNPNWLPSGGKSWSGNTATDAQMIILDPATGREWDLWRYSYASGVITVSNGNLVPGSYWTKVDGFPGSRGVGIEYLAMLPRPQEVTQGAVKHALPLLIPNMSGAFRTPATKSDGPWGLANIPAGTRFALRVTDTDIAEWLNALPSCITATGKASLRTLAVAERDYGMIVVDHAGSTHVQLEDVAEPAAKTGWANLGLATQTCANGKTYPQDAFDGLLSPARLVALAP